MLRGCVRGLNDDLLSGEKHFQVLLTCFRFSGCFEDVSGMIRGCFGDVLGLFRGCVGDVSGMFRG